MEKYKPKFAGPVLAYVYNGPAGQGDAWVPIELNFELIFDLMIEGRTVGFMRQEDSGVLYWADTHGKDRDATFIEYLNKFGRYQPLKKTEP